MEERLKDLLEISAKLAKVKKVKLGTRSGIEEEIKEVQDKIQKAKEDIKSVQETIDENRRSIVDYLE